MKFASQNKTLTITIDVAQNRYLFNGKHFKLATGNIEP